MKNNKPKVSVIIPIYNSEKYLEMCLKSLVEQTLTNVEIICVNDGSKDNSLDIINKYKSKYEEKIVIINKDNEGVWKARIDGITMAKGEYICFCDSDDYVDKFFLEKMYNCIENQKADMCICGFERINSQTNKPYSIEMIKEKSPIYTSKNVEEIISINTALWNKIYKASTIRNVVSLKNPPRVLEDMMFLMLIYQNIEKIVFLPEALYYYIVREGTAISSSNEKDIEDVKKAMLELKNIYINNNYNNIFLEVLDCVFFLHFGISLMFRLSYTEKKRFKKLLKDSKYFLNNNFKLYRNSKFLNLNYILRKKSSNIKVAIMRKIYTLNLFTLFLDFYKFMINTLKIDIKW